MTRAKGPRPDGWRNRYLVHSQTPTKPVSLLLVLSVSVQGLGVAGGKGRGGGHTCWAALPSAREKNSSDKVTGSKEKNSNQTSWALLDRLVQMTKDQMAAFTWKSHTLSALSSFFISFFSLFFSRFIQTKVEDALIRGGLKWTLYQTRCTFNCHLWSSHMDMFIHVCYYKT